MSFVKFGRPSRLVNPQSFKLRKKRLSYFSKECELDEAFPMESKVNMGKNQRNW